MFRSFESDAFKAKAPKSSKRLNVRVFTLFFYYFAAAANLHHQQYFYESRC